MNRIHQIISKTPVVLNQKLDKSLDSLVDHTMTYEDLLKQADPNDNVGFTTSIALDVIRKNKKFI